MNGYDSCYKQRCSSKGIRRPIQQAGPAKTIKTSQYRRAALIFSSSDLKFCHVVWTKLTKTVVVPDELEKKKKNVDFSLIS